MIAEIDKGESMTLGYFHKLHPEKPFGSYEVNMNLMTIETEIVEEILDDEAQGSMAPAENVAMSNEDLIDISDEKQCQACTIFNHHSAEKCTMCGSAF